VEERHNVIFGPMGTAPDNQLIKVTCSFTRGFRPECLFYFLIASTLYVTRAGRGRYRRCSGAAGKFRYFEPTGLSQAIAVRSHVEQISEPRAAPRRIDRLADMTALEAFDCCCVDTPTPQLAFFCLPVDRAAFFVGRCADVLALHP
jgi:hypothetical protein